MAPMIDMVFLLLVFFMCVSSLADVEDGIELDLPESNQSKIADDQSDRGTVSIDAEGNVYLGKSTVDSAHMKRAIQELIQRKADARIVVRADKRTEYRYVKKVLKDCAEVGAYEVIYATYEG